MQKFLIIQTAFIGDVVLATALAEKLHAFYPGAQIDFLLRKGNENLLKGHPFIQQVMIWDKKNGKYKSLWKLLLQIRERKYDKVINVQRYGATGFLTAFSGAGQRIGFDKNPFSFFFDKRIRHQMGTGMHLHEIERNLLLIKDFTDTCIYKPRLYPTAEDYVSVKQFKNSRYICIAPASVWFTKQFPAEKWISFINKIESEISVYLIGAPGEKSLCSDIARNAVRDVVDLSGQLSFLQSAALMKDAVMNYVNDSAPMHFASAMNAPVTAVYCSTVPAFGYGPLSDNSNIVEIKDSLPCRPCGLHGYKACPLQHFKCAMNISDEQLLKLLNSEN